MKLKRPTRWPCSADSSRKAGKTGSRPRSLRNALTGVSRSSMKLWRRATRLCSRASARTSSRDGSTGSSVGECGPLAATAIEHLLGVAERAAARVQQHRQVVQDVGGLLVDALVGLLARGAGHLLGLLLDLGADARRVVEELDRVGARGALGGPRRQRALERGQGLVGREQEVAVVKAGALAGVAGGACGLDQGEQRVSVTIHPHRAYALRVAGRCSFMPELRARTAPQMQLAGIARAC